MRIEERETYEYWGRKILQTSYTCDHDCSTCEEYCDYAVKCDECGEYYDSRCDDECPYCNDYNDEEI